METKPQSKSASKSLFDFEGDPGFKKSMPIALQHLLAMIVGNTLPAIVLTGQLANTQYALSPEESLYLIQAGMFIAAIATFLQIYPVMKVGAKLPVIMGVSFAYIPVLTSIGVKYGIGAVYGSQLVGGIVAFIVGMNIKRIYKYFPPMVTGTVVLTIGLSLYPVALNYMAGGNGNPMQGDIRYWAVAVLTLLVVLFCNMFTKGLLKLAAILIGIVVGYIASLAMGLVDLGGISDAAWISIPRIMPFKLEFPIDAVITMSVMFVVNSIQAVGDLSSTTAGGFNRTPTGEELEGGIKANGVASIIGSVIGGLPTATYSQNVGIVSLTKVVTKHVFKFTAILILISGFIPKFGAIMLSVPQAVIGGATITVFAQITMSGMKLITSDEMSSRNVTIVGLGIALGMGIVQLGDQAVAQFPEWFRMVFTSSPVVLATVVVFLLNLIVPKKTVAEEEAERKMMENE
ncbi:nucleobase:cation symporter-2 family protein [Anaerococcus sp. AGMB09787]|uniref:uracil-xanthine permease family protein n=1 Tax=Anaerococcus sp. AGMB09787 TaxID=2922869 RepID=UPI001FAF808B|nr:nucleobase:cation symporter-2 family protein [Anaerococcus sp. AGMB09787]